MATTEPRTGIKVIVVGAGFGGLTAAIECHRQGHDVVIYESFAELKPLGDVLSVGSNGGRIFNRWGKYPGEVAERLREHCTAATECCIRKFDAGEVVLVQKLPDIDPMAPSFNGYRAGLHQVVFEYARDDLGIPIHLGQNISEYFEEEDKAGIVLKSGERIVADAIIGADGVGSKARHFVLGFEDKPKSSGYAIWRAWFPITDIVKDPRTKVFCENGDSYNTWIGKDVHFIFLTTENSCCWLLTHKDEHDIDESWSFPGKLEEVFEVLKEWDPTCKAIVEKTPSFVDWKLVYRDPLPTWVSKKQRIVLLGDSAHPFLPTSTQGATQAVEDGATVALCLRMAGKENVQAALKTHEEIRYERVRAIQKTGEANRDNWHKVDWAKISEDPSKAALPREDWIYLHDAEGHAKAVFNEIFKKHSGMSADRE